MIYTVPKRKGYKTMKNAYELRKGFTLRNHNTTITRAEFEARFTATRETVTFTFHGWDGQSYEGESRRARVLRSNEPGFEAYKFVKVGKSVHYIDDDYLVLEKATGERHPGASWLVDVERA